MGPDWPKWRQDGPKRTIKSPKVAKTFNCKHLKKPTVFQGFWGSRPSKTASEDPRRVPRGYLGLLGDILSHLEPSGFLGLWLLIAILAHFGVHFGAQNWLNFHIFGGHFLDQFLDHFWATLGAILEAIWGPDRPKKGPRWAQESHEELQRPTNLHLQKP